MTSTSQSTMKLKQRHRDRFATYLRWWRVGRAGRFTLHAAGEALAKARAIAQQKDRAFYSPPGSRTPSAFEAFWRHESTADLWKSDNEQKLDRAMCGKALLNLQIKMWADGVAEGVTFVFELQEDGRLSWLPDWVWTAVTEQAKTCYTPVKKEMQE